MKETPPSEPCTGPARPTPAFLTRGRHGLLIRPESTPKVSEGTWVGQFAGAVLSQTVITSHMWLLEFKLGKAEKLVSQLH